MNYIYNMTIIKSTLLTKIKSSKNKEVQKQSSINYILARLNMDYKVR